MQSRWKRRHGYQYTDTGTGGGVFVCVCVDFNLNSDIYNRKDNSKRYSVKSLPQFRKLSLAGGSLHLVEMAE